MHPPADNEELAFLNPEAHLCAVKIEATLPLE
jgi:hypothetical protein